MSPRRLKSPLHRKVFSAHSNSRFQPVLQRFAFSARKCLWQAIIDGGRLEFEAHSFLIFQHVPFRLGRKNRSSLSLLNLGEADGGNLVRAKATMVVGYVTLLRNVGLTLYDIEKSAPDFENFLA